MVARQDRPSRSGRAGRLGLVAAGCAAAAVLIAIVLVLDPTRGRGPGDRAGPGADEIIELVPESPTGEELARTTFDLEGPPELPALDAGGWIQVADPRGRLAQQYRFDELDPNPPGMPEEWARMTAPEAHIYGSHNRVLALRGDSALVHLPRRALESGRLTGDPVTIMIYELESDRLLDTAADRPMAVVRTGEAEYDSFMGTVRVEGRFEVETTWGECAGWGLVLAIDEPHEVYNVTLDRLEGELRVAAAAWESRDGAGETPPEEAVATTEAPSGAAPGGIAPAPPAQIYRLALHENVRVRQGPEAAARTLAGDLLTVTFRPQGEGLGRSLRGESERRGRPPGAGPLPLPALIPALALAAPGPDGTDAPIAPAPRDDDVLVSCSGRVTLTPVPEPSPPLASQADIRLEVSGRPARLRDAGREAEVDCARLVYHAERRRLEVFGTPEHPLEARAPQLEAAAESFWLETGSGLAGLTGAGRLEVHATGTDAGAAPATGVAWSERADLTFDRAAGSEELGPLRDARFQGRVRVERADVTVWADEATAGFRSAPQPGNTAARVELEDFAARGSVHAAMRNGARVFADELTGNAAEGRVDLRGPDVVVVFERWVLDGGRHVTGNDRDRTITWEGPGRARSFAGPVPEPPPGPAAAPQPEGAPQLVANWNESLGYDGSLPGSGRIDLDGGVEVLSTPAPGERGTVRARSVTLHLAGDGAGGAAPGAVRSQRVERIVARGGARIENRSRPDPGRPDATRLFYLAGEEVEYDPRTGEGRVPGAGDLLLVDPGTGHAPDADGAGPWRSGTTSFRWSGSLAMTRAAGSLYAIDIGGEVEMRHLAPDGGRTTLACARLEALVERPGAAGDAAGAGEAMLGGTADLRGVRAAGEVFLRTPERDVDCEELDYDVAAGRARLRAAPGDFVTVYTRGQPEPLRLAAAEWDLRTDTVTVLGASGGGG